jgi:hydroxymethylpyrimidine pyrophosphatase-like HAD family hydrolase
MAGAGVALVVTDLDGTLSDAGERVHPASARAVRWLQAAGVPVPVARAVGGSGSASVVRDLVYGGHTLQVRPPGVSKWSGVLAFCADQGLDPGRVLAVGDSANDLELLEAAKVACAVAGASPAVLARADHVLGPPGVGGWAGVLDLV